MLSLTYLTHNQFTLECFYLAKHDQFNTEQLSRIVEMAWEDRTPFEAIEMNFDIGESEVISIMRSEVKPRSFRLWRKRVSGRKTKHLALRSPDVNRGYCPTQYKQR
jgi:uncharacterized protein (TIGR03643 family)